jgi:hypothetical protein
VFSVDAILIRPLPYAHPDRLVVVAEKRTGGGAMASFLAALLFGVMSVLRESRGVLTEGLKEGARSMVAGRRRLSGEEGLPQ